MNEENELNKNIEEPIEAENMDDFSLEPNEEFGDLDGALAKIKKEKEKLKVCLNERQEYLTNWQKERADFQNYKKDEIERISRMTNLAREKLIFDLLPALDSFDMAFANKEVWEKVDKNWRVGVEYIQQQILKILEENGISLINTKVGDSFDPNLHQSIQTIETSDVSQDHTISAVIQSGYRSKDRILRPSLVNVFGYKS